MNFEPYDVVLMSGHWLAVVENSAAHKVRIRTIKDYGHGGEPTVDSNITEISPEMINVKLLNIRELIGKLESVNYPHGERFEFYLNIDLSSDLLETLNKFLSHQLRKKITIRILRLEGMSKYTPQLATNFDDPPRYYNPEYERERRMRREREKYEEMHRRMIEEGLHMHNPFRNYTIGLDQDESRYIDRVMQGTTTKPSGIMPPKKKSKFSVIIDKEVKNLKF